MNKRKKFAYGGTGFVTPDIYRDIVDSQLEVANRQRAIDNNYQTLDFLGKSLAALGQGLGSYQGRANSTTQPSLATPPVNGVRTYAFGGDVPPPPKRRLGSYYRTRQYNDDGSYYDIFDDWVPFKSGEIHPATGERIYLEDLDEETRPYYETYAQERRVFHEPPTVQPYMGMSLKFDGVRKNYYPVITNGQVLNPSDFDNRYSQLRKMNPQIKNFSTDRNFYYSTAYPQYGKTYAEGGSVGDNQYQIQKGDDLWNIGEKIGLSVNQLLELNPQIKNPNFIKTGDIINISPDYGNVQKVTSRNILPTEKISAHKERVLSNLIDQYNKLQVDYYKGKEGVTSDDLDSLQGEIERLQSENEGNNKTYTPSMTSNPDTGGEGDRFRTNISNDLLELQTYAEGGQINSFYESPNYNANIPIEAEGQELIQYPNGNMYEIQGASHEQGGVPMSAPAGSTIYSNRLKGVDDKKMNERKAFRERYLSRLEKLVSLNPRDKMLKRTYEKALKDFMTIEQQDIEYMNHMNDTSQYLDMIMRGGVGFNSPEDSGLTPKFKQGGGVFPSPLKNSINTYPYQQGLLGQDMNYEAYIRGGLTPHQQKINTTPYQQGLILSDSSQEVTPYNSTYKEAKPSLFKRGAEAIGQLFQGTGGGGKTNFTFGDALGLYGYYRQGTDPLGITNKQRSEDRSNINPYIDYGKAGYDKIQQLRGGLYNNHLNALKGVASERDLAIQRMNTGARGINTQRALGLATDYNLMKAQGDIYNNYGNALSQLTQTEAQMLNQIDQMNATGRLTQDENNRKDRDAFYTNLQRDTRYQNNAIQMAGAYLNNLKERKYKENLNNQWSDFYYIDEGGILRSKGQYVDKINTDWEGLPYAYNEAWNKGVAEGNYFSKDGKYFNSKGNEVDIRNFVNGVFLEKENGITTPISQKPEVDYKTDFVYLYGDQYKDFTNEDIKTILERKSAGDIGTMTLSNGQEFDLETFDPQNTIYNDVLYLTTERGTKIPVGSALHKKALASGKKLIPIKEENLYTKIDRGNTVYTYTDNKNKKVKGQISNDKINDFLKKYGESFYTKYKKPLSLDDPNTISFFKEIISNPDMLKTKNDLLTMIANN